MRNFWPAMIVVLAALTAGGAHADRIAPGDAGLHGAPAMPPVRAIEAPDFNTEPSAFGFVPRELWTEGRTFVVQAYDRAPALVLGLATIFALPPLLFVGVVLRHMARPRTGPARAAKSRHARPGATAPIEPVFPEPAPIWPCNGWIELEGRHDWRLPVGHGVVRLGREGDNDLCITDKSVHRYHAAIHRAEDAEFVITDLSSAGGNGVVVNGRKVSAARLRNGDRIELGLARLMFVARPA